MSSTGFSLREVFEEDDCEEEDNFFTEDTPDAFEPPAHLDIGPKRPLTAAERKRRSRAVHKYHRRKVGKEEKERAVQERRKILSGETRSFINVLPNLAQAIWNGPDSKISSEDLKAERQLYYRLTAAVRRAQAYAPDPSLWDEVRSSRIKTPAKVMWDALAKAQSEGASYMRKPFHDPDLHARESHRLRRRVAGIEQVRLLVLEGPGDSALKREQQAKRMILLGHRVNLVTFRQYFDPVTFAEL
ncbi:hypothetical protein K488DRAFT_91364 [Vararia minispora EC-137]|uniref:Uncharacterized protein n=1 Tax=Vararia minispora EC-137 TaxID=1314806 RepID=A0ACB8Q639_9AGAM|nr:hypothetical protein K488DRAFT_91364 [Vararia minispora EC-137]